jgi:hypothetical protein
MQIKLILVLVLIGGFFYHSINTRQTHKIVQEIIAKTKEDQAQLKKYQKVKFHAAQPQAIQEDIERILQTATESSQKGWAGRKIQFTHKAITNGPSKVKLSQSGQTFVLAIESTPEKWGETFYYGLQKLGFLFPHPREQITPSVAQAIKACGKTYTWTPRFEYRGFHFHTQHPNEWVHGFLMGDKETGRQTLRWLARNGQNVGQVLLLDQPIDKITANIKDLIHYSQSLGVSFGVDVSFNMIQQKAYRLVNRDSRLKALGFFRGDIESELKASLAVLKENLPFDFMTIEVGSSEFTSNDYRDTLNKMNLAGEILEQDQRALFIKVHATAGQLHKDLGNYNYLPQYANSSVGVLPHTVMFFALADAAAPVYGRQDFADMAEFLKAQSKFRETWYFPETSYFIAMDIDVPLFLTDYLIARSQDMDDVQKWGATGHLNFTTGHELGYWLKDWTVALLANQEYAGNPYIALDLLGEDRQAWEPILTYQNKFFKKQGLLEELSSANLLDEINVGMITHQRTVFRNLRKKPELLARRIDVIEKAIAERPSLKGVKNEEVRSLLEVTDVRLEQALYLRKALLLEAQDQRDSQEWLSQLDTSKALREKAQVIMDNVIKKYNRYPEAKTFERYENLTSYPFGYGYPASNLHFWAREENMIRTGSYWPWFMNLYSIKRIIL